jgi:hypothetical protein
MRHPLDGNILQSGISSTSKLGSCELTKPKLRLPRWFRGAIIGASIYCLILGGSFIVTSTNPFTPEGHRAMCAGEESQLIYFALAINDALKFPGSWFIEKIYDFRLSFATRDNPLNYRLIDFAIRDLTPMILSSIIPFFIGGMIATRKKRWVRLGISLVVVSTLLVVSMSYLSLAISCLVMD